MELYLLASGSSGNCALVTAGHGRLLVDAGIAMRRIARRAADVGAELDGIAGILLTHAHSDHTGGLKMLFKYHRIPIYCTQDCAAEICRAVPELNAAVRLITPGEAFDCGGFHVCAFPTSHDSPGSVGWRIESAGRSLAFVTDLGYVSKNVARAVSGVDAAVIETNHDPGMLMRGPYPYPLKCRILSECGHLSNEDGARLAVHLAQGGAGQLILAHLSEANNTPELAYDCVKHALEDAGLTAELTVAGRDEITGGFRI